MSNFIFLLFTYSFVSVFLLPYGFAHDAPAPPNDEPCQAKNETFSYCAKCDSCNERGGNCLMSTNCTARCTCVPGYLRNNEGQCVPEAACDCGENEVYDPCLRKCPPETCAAIGRAYRCAAQACTPGCKCKKNFRRDKNNVCVPIYNCPPRMCNVNEFWDVCRPTPRCVDERCSKFPRLACFYLWDGTCMPRCSCFPGFCRNSSGVCVRVQSTLTPVVESTTTRAKTLTSTKRTKSLPCATAPPSMVPSTLEPSTPLRTVTSTSECVPSSIWRVDCGTYCYCNSYGTGFFCYLVPCGEGSSTKSQTEEGNNFEESDDSGNE